MDIDKDIEKIQNFLKYNETMRENETYIIEFREAIENLISFAENEALFIITYDKQFQELETYKKIAEKLAEEVEVLHTEIVKAWGSWQEDYVLENDVNTTKEAVLDWARNEVKKDE